jgi:hypothetical protein
MVYGKCADQLIDLNIVRLRDFVGGLKEFRHCALDVF